MKVSELIDYLSRCNGDENVVVPVADTVTMGPSPSVSIVHAQGGIDWDQNTVFLLPAVDLIIKESDKGGCKL